MKKTSLVLIVLSILLQSCQTPENSTVKSEFTDGTPEEAGLIPKRLNLIDQAIEAAIKNGEVAGTVAFIAKDGVIGYHKAFGKADMETGKDMTTGNLFRIASMSKLMTTVGALILFERGKYDLNTKLSDILPEFKNPAVLKGWDDKNKAFITKISPRWFTN